MLAVVDPSNVTFPAWWGGTRCARGWARPLPMYRWHDLEPLPPPRRKLFVLNRLHGHMRNFDKVECLSVAAFAAALVRRRANGTAAHAGDSAPPPHVLDIGANMGYYAVLGSALGARVTAVEMQPLCAQIAGCHVRLNDLSSRVTIINGYVAPPATTAAVSVPADRCDPMASPSAVRGRFPNGKLRRAREGERAGSEQPVWPLAIGAYADEHVLPRGVGFAVTKLDTEGFEVLALESLRPVWSRLGELLIELQPTAWEAHGVGLERGLSTLRELMAAARYRAVLLPHRVSKTDSFNQLGRFDVCALPTAARPVRPEEALRRGLRGATVYPSYEMFAELLRELHARARKHGYFHDFLFTARTCP